MAPPRVRVKGTGSIPSGYVLGRESRGAGDVQLLKIAPSAQGIAGAGSHVGSTITLVQPAAGLTITESPTDTYTFALANDLAALEAMSATGLAARTGADTWAQRSIAGTAARLSVANGDGVAGNPTLDIDAAYVGQASITTLGMVATGTWAATKIGLAFGGTNADLSATGGASQVLKQSSAGAAITVGQLANTDITGLGTMSTQNASAVAITGGTVAGLTGFAIRDTSAAFDVTLAAVSAPALSAGRTLTFDMSDVAHTLDLGTTANTITFPSAASYTVAGLSVAGTWSATQTSMPLSGATLSDTTTLPGSGVITAAGSIGVGIAVPLAALHVEGGNTGFRSSSSAALGAGSGGGVIITSSAGIPSAADQRLGLVLGGAIRTGTTYSFAAGLVIFSDDAWTSSSTPASLRFETIPNGSILRSERMRLHSSGGLSLGNTIDPGTGNLSANTITGLTGLAIRDTSAAFDVTIAAVSAPALSAGRTLIIDMSNVAHTLDLGATANTITFPSAASYTVAGLSVAGTWSATQTSMVLSGATLSDTTTLPNGGVIESDGDIGVRIGVPLAALHVEGGNTGFRSSSSVALGAASGGGVVITSSAGIPSAAGQRLGLILAGAINTGSAYIFAAGISIFTEGAWTGSSTPASLRFETAPSGSVTRSERMRITEGGLVAFGGGATSSFPALKRSAAILQARLADDSAYAYFEANILRTATAYTVATLPAAGTAGRRAYVTDALAPAFLTAVVGGGAVVTPVFDNGTNWVAE